MNSTLPPRNAQPDLTAPLPLLSQPFVMENWQVIPELNRLQNKQTNQSRSIEPRLMHLLCFLAANQFTVVGRDSLVEQLWPNVIVNENSLTRAVSELRKQLRGGCRDNAIETIPKRGYRLVCAIQNSTGSATLVNPTPSATRETSLPAFFETTVHTIVSMAPTPKPAFIAITLAALLTATTAIYSVGDITGGSAGNLANTSASESNGLIRIPTVLTDEVLVKEPSYSNFLGVQLALSAADTQESNGKSTTRPIVSHDGSSYAYLSYDKKGSTIFVGSLNEMSAPCAVYQDPEKLVNMAWSPVGQSLLFSKTTKLTNAALFSNSQISNKHAESALLVLNVASGKVQRLVEEELPKHNRVVNESSLT